jgi:hypothetical protein
VLNAVVCSRLHELEGALSAATIAPEISSRNSRIAALQKRWARLRAGLGLILDQRGADMVDIPGGASGMLCRDYKGKEADRLVTRVDPGVVSLVAELRGHARQAAEELEQWKTRVKVRKPLDVSPAAVTLAMLMTTAELEQLERNAWNWRGRRRSPQRDRRVQARPRPADYADSGAALIIAGKRIVKPSFVRRDDRVLPFFCANRGRVRKSGIGLPRCRSNMRHGGSASRRRPHVVPVQAPRAQCAVRPE